MKRMIGGIVLVSLFLFLALPVLFDAATPPANRVAAALTFGILLLLPGWLLFWAGWRARRGLPYYPDWLMYGLRGPPKERETTPPPTRAPLADAFAGTNLPAETETTKRLDHLREAFAETLAKGVGQIVEGGRFEAVTTTSAENAVVALFDKALPATPSLSADAVQSHYERIKAPWYSQKLFRGSRDEIRSVVLENLFRIRSEPGFRDFTISVDLTLGAAQILASSPPYAIPVCVWRSGDVYLACGNSDFRG